jgi:hypothetical protein
MMVLLDTPSINSRTTYNTTAALVAHTTESAGEPVFFTFSLIANGGSAEQKATVFGPEMPSKLQVSAQMLALVQLVSLS